MSNFSRRRLAPILGLLGALGPLSIDMYLPGMPQIAYGFSVDESEVQLSLMSFFGGLMIGQLVFGPLSDALGRKPMLLAGLFGFVASSIGCVMADSSVAFCIWRFLQGLGGSVGFVVGLAIVRDLHSGRAAASLISLVMVVQGVAPIVAPMIGSTIIAYAPWQMIFVSLAIFGAGCIFLVCVALPETRDAAYRTSIQPLDVIRLYQSVILDRKFLPYASVLALAMAGFFAYLAGSSFVFISVHGLSPTIYSALFAINAFGLVVGAQIAPRLMTRFTPERIIMVALAVYGFIAVAILSYELLHGAGTASIAGSLFIITFSVAFVMPLASALALEPFGAVSGAASALMGGMNFAAGTVATLFVAAFADGTAKPMLITIAFFALSATGVAAVFFPRKSLLRASLK
ncbi:multidrug effflux MFS transporter (plasmid) [Agrobacterium salinitolerans]|uniref:Bcr/CflA family efflux transporter n=1 Tax=Agrobacterium salinitolerans TaxID=1183413 RepID=A0A4Z1R206_9HYPH|nr:MULTISPECIES: multidrug effflux MFS transporter [Agrobacterium]MDH6298273.1 DHA1 family bicyclomycin/chloramphenicol resistance-like MFS transporter [Agrobacterium fabrum]UYZ10918.1 multidrug effflux MFS transporter [Agrobacterium salinitolerans]